MQTIINRQHIRCSTVVVLLVLGLLLIGNSPVLAQDSDVGEPPPSVETDANVAKHLPRVGFSPFTPPEHNDTTFVVDSSSGLDTECAFRDEGPLIFEIEINRYIGDRDKLISNGLLSANANLKMPAFDVDFIGEQGFNPERDRIWFNDKVVPGEFLKGENDTWILNDLSIPVGWINFPSDPGEGGTLRPATNTLRIDIDTANTDLVWCTAIDWATLTIDVARPILMVHGIFSDGRAWNQPGKFQWSAAFDDLGIPNATIDMHKFPSIGLDSIQDNAKDIADKVNELRQRWGVDRLNIVAHSKGGIDSRHYVESNSTVEKLIQIGTPNAGSPLADAAQAGGVQLLGIIPTAIIDGLAGPAAINLTTPYMAIYNEFHGANSKTSYVSLAGDYRFGGLGIIDAVVQGFYDGPNDTIVPASSVHALGYATHLTYSSSGNDKSAEHTSLNTSAGIYNRVLPFVKTLGLPTPSLLAATVGLASPTEINAGLDQAATDAGAVTQGQIKSHAFFIDTTQSTVFMLQYGSGNLNLTLVSPSGHRIDPAVAAADPAAEYTALEDTEGSRFEFYGIQNPEVGQWTLEVVGEAVVNSAGQEPYVLTAIFDSSAIQMESDTDLSAYSSGDSIGLRTQLLNNTMPITGANVTAKVVFPDETISTVTLVDDGTGSDTVANDGIYTGLLAATDQPGLYRFLVSAEKVASPAFNRDHLLLAFVSASRSGFSGAFDDFGNDIDEDGLFEELVINVGVDVTDPATYRMIGLLTDSSGVSISSALAETDLTVGAQTVALRFEGRQIFEKAIDGPYTLKIIRLAEDDGFTVLPLDEQTEAYTTGAYSYTQFRGSAVAIPGTGSDQGIDTDGDSLFNQLEISLDVIVANTDLYEWSARLVDVNGAELGVFANSGILNVGRNTITFNFVGEVIGANGVDGPYFLNDLLIFGGSDSAVVLQAYTTSDYQVMQFEVPPPRPDLVIQEIVASGSNVRVTILNQGPAAVPAEQGFWVDLYIDPSALPTQPNQIWNFLSDEGLVWGVDGDVLPMEPGEVITLTLGDALYWPDLSKFSGTLPAGTPIYVQVDSANTDSTYGGILESDEALGQVYNNVAGPIPAVVATTQETIHLPLLNTQGTGTAATLTEDTPQHTLPSRTQVETDK